MNPVTKKKEFILIGTTSRGTGIRGNCGGLDNPTHYVRVKKFVKWIKVIIAYFLSKFRYDSKAKDSELDTESFEPFT